MSETGKQTTGEKSETAAKKKGFWAFLNGPCEHPVRNIAIVGIIIGIIFWGGLNTAMEYTNRADFCTSCHSMSIPLEEMKNSVHFKNRSGTSVGCSECHVASSKSPSDYSFKMLQKIVAARDVWGEITGIIDTPEKYEAHRQAMAERVWARMKERDSKECRNCHDFKKMDHAKQKQRSIAKHEGAQEDGKTCIDCHKGISHRLPGHKGKTGTPAVEAVAPVALASPPAADVAAGSPADMVGMTGMQGMAGMPGMSSMSGMSAGMSGISGMVGLSGEGGNVPDTTGGINWTKVPSRKVTLFYPGQAAVEWVLNKETHSSASDITDKKRPCAKCHEGDASDVGDAIVAGKPVGAAKTVLEPTPPAGKNGSIPVAMQAAYDANKIYFRFEWVPPKITGNKMDKKNEVKLAMMFDGGGTVDLAPQGGCWATCHTDLRGMKDAADDKKTKYLKDGALAGGKFMDLIQFRSGDKKVVDGHVADSRVTDGGKSLLKAEGKKEGNKWVVVFERELAGKGKGDHTIAPGKVYNFGFAVHEDFTEGRYHYVSLGYQFGLGKENKEVKNYINVVKQ